MEQSFDVFLSHNSQDKPQVAEIAARLRDMGVKYWLDEEQLRPGLDWQPPLEEAIRASKATAVFVGPSGMGTWENAEMQAALNWAQGKKIPVIPVALPGMPTTVELPMFLSNRTWVRFRTLDDVEAVERLRWGITGEPPARRARRTRPADPDDQRRTDPVEDAVQKLAASLRSSSMTYIVGNALFAGSPDLPPGSLELARELLQKLNVGGEQAFVPMDLAGNCFAMQKGDRLLEDEVVDMIVERSHVIPPLYAVLAKLVDLQGQRPPARSRGSSDCLIVTTNIDVLLERALVAAALPFSRIVQGRADSVLHISTYEGVRRLSDERIELPGAGAVVITDSNALDGWIQGTGERTVQAKDVSFHEMVQPILYKFNGSQDVEDSCAISSAHYLELALASTRGDFLPTAVQSTIGGSPSLFLGCDPLSPEFLCMYYSLLQKSFRVGTERRLRYAPMLPPANEGDDFYCHLQAILWDSIEEFTLQQMSIRILSERPEQFLRRLYEAARVQLLGAA